MYVLCSCVHAYMNTHLNIYMAYMHGRCLPILFHSAAFHGARRKKEVQYDH